MAIFQVEVPDKYLTQLSTGGRASFLTTLVINGVAKVIEVDILVLRSKEFVYTQTAILGESLETADRPDIILPRVDPE